MDILSMFLRVTMFLELHFYAFGWLDPCHEKDNNITLFRMVYGFSKCREDDACFATHMLENKKLLSLKQWHLKIGYPDKIVSCNTIKRYILLPYWFKIALLKNWMNAPSQWMREGVCTLKWRMLSLC